VRRPALFQAGAVIWGTIGCGMIRYYLERAVMVVMKL
jgi:hypothetical protein